LGTAFAGTRRRRDANPNSHSATHARGDGNFHCDTHIYPYSHANGNTYLNAFSYADSYGHA
jgi:hypothetical protein